MYPKDIKNLMECFELLPGIGEKTAERLSFSLLNFDKDKLTEFADSIIGIRDNIKNCMICNNITDKDICYICENENRKNGTIFVVENAKDVILFEKLGIYKGEYHVLGGLISPLDGINPEDISVDNLIERIKNGKYTEIIVALKPSVEGETTVQYIKKMLEGYDIKLSKIASGVPIGAEIESYDFRDGFGRKKIFIIMAKM